MRVPRGPRSGCNLHYVYVGTRLGGEVDPARRGVLDLPSFESGGSEETTQPLAGIKAPEGGNKKGADNRERPFILSESLPVVPAKLVKRILKGVFVDMVELLKDNMEVERRRALAEGESRQGHLQRTTRREVLDMLSWLLSPLFQSVCGSGWE